MKNDIYKFNDSTDNKFLRKKYELKYWKGRPQTTKTDRFIIETIIFWLTKQFKLKWSNKLYLLCLICFIEKMTLKNEHDLAYWRESGKQCKKLPSQFLKLRRRKTKQVLLCISTSFWVLPSPKSWSNYFFQPISTFFVYFKSFSVISWLKSKTISRYPLRESTSFCMSTSFEE